MILISNPDIFRTNVKMLLGDILDNMKNGDNLEKGIELADIVMMLRIQKERINDADLPSEDEYFNSFGLTYKKLLKAKHI